jgi:hypothetical protein
LTINIPPKSMINEVNKHAMCWILFIIHLVPLVLVELFLCKNLSKNRLNWWQIWTWESSGRGRGPWAHLAVPLGPLVALPHHQSMEDTPKAMPSVHSMLVWSKAEIGWPWIHEPIVIHLGGSNQLLA